MASFDQIKDDCHELVKGCFESQNVDKLQKKYEAYRMSDSDKRSLLDQSFRDLLLEYLTSSRSNEFSKWESFVTFCIEACRRDLCNPTMPVVLLGDMFDALTLDQCEQLFTFVENGVNIWREELFFSACKNNLLRMCNDLLRRLSRSQNTVFCGRILLFLAKFFPFSERSGLNIVSEFNLDNITEFGGEGSSNLKDIIAVKDESVEEVDEKTESKLKIDYNLYCKFWALQDFFRNPNQCYNKLLWKTFTAHASNVLSAFSSYKLDDVQWKRRKLLPPNEQVDESPMRQQHYFAKFLTNQKLLELQLSDSNFRRYVLLQFLIVFQYLNSPVKFKVSRIRSLLEDNSHLVMANSETHELKGEYAEWVKETTELVYKLLAETPPDGPTFVSTVKHILKREEHWNAWKNEGCPEFQKPEQVGSAEDGVGGDDSTERRKSLPRPRKRKQLGELIKDAAANNRYYMGNSELTRLWNLCPNNLEACKSKERDFLPSLDSYFEEAMEQSDPSALVEDEFKRVNDGNFGWRALRLLARRSPHFFTHSNNPINKLPEYLETMIRKIIKDKPNTLNDETSTPPLVPDDSTKTSEVLETVQETEVEDEELLKGVDKEEETVTDNPAIGIRRLTQEQLDAVAARVGAHWKKLAVKLGYQANEIDFFETENTSEQERAKNLLQIWSEDDEDASPENLAYTLEGLDLLEAAELLKEN